MNFHTRRVSFAALCSLVASTALAVIPASERAALLSLFQATNGPSWTDKSGWNGGVGTECDWYGIDCNSEDNTVTSVSLAGNKLEGIIPPQIADLANLESLDLSGNEIRGSIPFQLGRLSRLEYLALGANPLTGPIPPELGDLVNLKNLTLEETQLSGTIPPRLGNLTNLEELVAGYTKLSGEIPPELGRLGKLVYLNLTENAHSGPIPPQLGDLASLELLFLGGNNLDGQIPAALTRLPKLRLLYLGGNRLSGPIPPDIANLTTLEELVLDNNQLTGEIPAALNRLTALRALHLHYNALTGPIPSSLGSLTQLEELLLGNNKLTGGIPAELRQLSRLRYLDLYLNPLGGPIPPDLGTLANLEQLSAFSCGLTGTVPSQLSQLSRLRTLDLSENGLEGTIPTELSRLANLETLSLAGNRLTGPIPPELGSLPKLADLFLDRNQLEGEIPLSLTNLTGLVNLYLYLNRMTGRIPEDLQKLTALQQLVIGENRFTGTIPPALMNLTNLNYLNLSGNQLEGPIPPQIGQLTKLEYLGLSSNLLSGPLPAEFGRLTNLIDAGLEYNFLSGAIPPLGQLKKLEVLLLNSNEFDALPADIGELSSIKLLSLFQNRFHMPLPPELGKLRTLVELELGANGFRGPVPREITNLTNLVDGQSDFSFNALFTSDPVIRDFLNRKQEGRDWEGSQTVTPLNVRVSGQTATAVALSWTRIPYLWDDGGYQVTVSTTPGGTPVKVQTTLSKEFSAIVVDELNPQTTYFFVVQTVSYPNDFQKNFLTSDPSATLQAMTTADVASPPQIVVTTFPFGMVQSEGAGADLPSDGYALINVGDTPTTITLTKDGSFFTQDPTTFTVEGGEEFYVSLQAVPQRPGAYEGASILSGVGVPTGLKVPVHLLSVETPTGTVIAQAAANRIDIAAFESERILNGTARFSNAGNAPLHGILVADVAWLIPQKDLIVIPPGQGVDVGFQIDRSLRTEDEETAAGTATGTLSLLYLQSSSTSGAQLKRRALQDTTNVSKSVVTIVDTVKPPVAPGELPPLAANEVALLIPGVGNLRGGSGFQFLSDIAVANAYGADTLRDLRMFFTPEDLALGSTSTAVDALAPSTAVQLGDVVKSVFNSPDQAGTLQLRTQRPESLTVSANIFNVSNPAGTYGAIIPVFRSDRALKPGERLFLTGLRRTDTSRTNLFLQEAGGQTATVQIEFLDASGTILGTITEALQPFRLRRVVNQVPRGGVTARVTNLATSVGRVLAYATPIDAESGDFWSVADWSQQFAAKRTEPVLIPVAGRARGANNTFFRTDVDIANVGATNATGTLRYHPQNAAPMDRAISIDAGKTQTYLDIVGELFEQSASVGYIVFTPRGGSFAVTSRTYATVGDVPASFGSGVPTVPVDAALRLGQSQVIGGVDIASTATITARKPATFRTNIGLIETTGQPVTVRVSVLYADARAKAFGALTSFEFRLDARQSLLISDLNVRLEPFSRGSDLRNAQLQFDVIAGQGAVVLYTSSIDNGTADSSFRLE